jgi:hypothetical protein
MNLFLNLIDLLLSFPNDQSLQKILGHLAGTIVGCGITAFLVLLTSFLVTKILKLIPQFKNKEILNRLCLKLSALTFFLLFPFDLLFGKPFQKIYIKIDIICLIVTPLLALTFTLLTLYRYFKKRKTA